MATIDQGASAVDVIRREAAFRYICALHELESEEGALSSMTRRILRQESAEIIVDLLSEEDLLRFCESTMCDFIRTA